MGTRQLRLQIDWWVSLTREQVGKDSIKVSATIDSTRAQWLEMIPELGPPEEMMPPNLAQGAHVRGTLALHQGMGSLPLRTEGDSILGNMLLPVLIPDLQPGTGARVSDTTYAQQPATRVVRSPQIPAGLYDPAGALGFWPDEPNPSELQGSLVSYVSSSGLLLGAKLNRRMNMTVPVMNFNIPGKGIWTATIEKVP